MGSETQFKEYDRNSGESRDMESGHAFEKKWRDNNLFKIIYILVFAIPFFIFLWAELRYDVNMPNWDDYNTVLNWIVDFSHSTSFTNRLDILFRQHNEHRVVFDRIIELLELHLLNIINFIYLDFVGFLGLILLVLLLSYLGRRSGLKKWEIVPIAFFMLTFSQNCLVSFSMASMAVYWGLLFSFTSFAYITKKLDFRHMAFGYLFSVTASCTSAGGLIGFPAITIYYLFNKKYKLATLWSIGAAPVFWLYFVFFPYAPTAIGIASHKYAYSHPILYAKYVVMFLGNMTHAAGGAFILGTLLLCCSIYLLLKRYIRLDSWTFAALIFILGTAAADGLSRISLGMDEPLSSRYTPFCASLVVLLYIAITSSQKKEKCRKIISSTGIALSLLTYILWFMPGIASLEKTHSLLDHQLAYPVQSRAYAELETAIKNHIFMPIGNIYRNLPSSLPLRFPCLYHKGYFGNIDALSISGGAIHISGWAALQNRDKPAATVIIDVDGKYYPSLYGIQRPDVAGHFHQKGYLYTGYNSTISIPSHVSGDCHISVIVVGSTRARFYESPVRTVNCS